MKDKIKQKIIEASVFSKNELNFINKIAKSAFNRNDRPLVLIGICGSILQNICTMSKGKISEKEIIKWIKMAIK